MRSAIHSGDDGGCSASPSRRCSPPVSFVGIGGALGRRREPVAGDGKVILKLGWTNEPDSLNPFVGYEGSSYEVWSLNYDMLVGFGLDGAPDADRGLAESWDGLRRRPHLDVQDPPGHDLAGRRARSPPRTSPSPTT